MKISSVLACLVFAVAAPLITRPWAPAKSSSFSFEIEAESEQSGLAQLYYDVGRGLNEQDSVLEPVVAGQPRLLRFSLPYGRFQTLRFDPLDRDTRMILRGARIVDGGGRTLVAFAPGQFRRSNQIDRLRVEDGKTLVETTPGGYDPQLLIRLDGPIVLSRPFWWRQIAWLLGLSLACVLAFEWAGRSRGFRLRERAAALRTMALASPGKALCAVALLGTVAANYPVILAGRSVVTPNLGVALLYGQNPWLPGFQSTEVGDPHKSDVAALLWHHLPLSVIEGRALRDGELPLWNRYDSAGLPLLGQGQSCFGDPLNMLPILARGAAWAWDLKILVAKWVFACGIGCCVWRLFRHLPTALLLAASIPFIGFFVYRINHPALFSLCYAPWILYCWLRCVDGRSARGAVAWLAALIGANWVEMNSGTAKEAYVLILSMNFAGVCLLANCGRPLGERMKLLGGLLAAGVAFAMVSSPVWLTFYRTLERSYTSYNAPLAFQIQPGMFIGLFDEVFYRPFQVESGVVNPSANVLILIGLLWAVICWRSTIANRQAAALILSCVPLLALVFALVPPAIVERIPVLGNILHVDNTFSCALIVLFAVASGFGWREAWMRLGSLEGRREGAAVLVLLLLLAAAYLGTCQAVLRNAAQAPTWGTLIHVAPFIYGYGLSVLAAAALLIWAMHRGLRRRSPTPALVILAVVAFGALHWRQGLQLGGGFGEYVFAPTHRVNLLARSPTIDAIARAGEAPSRVIGFGNDFLPGWSGVYGLEGISGPDALVNPYYREYMDSAGFTRVWDWRYMVAPSEIGKLKPVLDSLNVRFYLGYREDRKQAARDLRFLKSEDMDRYESPSVWPRAFFTDSVAVYDNLPQFFSWMRAGDGRPFAGIGHDDWIQLQPVPRVSGDLGTRKVSPAEDYRLTPNTTSFTVTATGPGFIVLTEAFEPDNFRATLNGKAVRYVRVNHAFKGIYVDEAGTYRVKFSYWPRGFSETLVLFVAGIGLIVTGLMLAVFMPKAGRKKTPILA
jgi:hypothetical protein